MSNDLQKKRVELENEADKHALALKIEYEKEKQKLKIAEFETQDMLRQEADKVKQQDFKHTEQLLKIKAYGYKEPVLKAMVLESTERIYQHLGINDMKVVNIAGGGAGSQDPAGQLIGQMVASYKSISESMQWD